MISPLRNPSEYDHPVRHKSKLLSRQTDQVRVADIGEGVGKGESIITVAGPSIHRGCQAIRQLRQFKRTSRFARSLILLTASNLAGSKARREQRPRHPKEKGLDKTAAE